MGKAQPGINASLCLREYIRNDTSHASGSHTILSGLLSPVMTLLLQLSCLLPAPFSVRFKTWSRYCNRLSFLAREELHIWLTLRCLHHPQHDACSPLACMYRTSSADCKAVCSVTALPCSITAYPARFWMAHSQVAVVTGTHRGAVLMASPAPEAMNSKCLSRFCLSVCPPTVCFNAALHVSKNVRSVQCARNLLLSQLSIAFTE